MESVEAKVKEISLLAIVPRGQWTRVEGGVAVFTDQDSWIKIEVDLGSIDLDEMKPLRLILELPLNA